MSKSNKSAKPTAPQAKSTSTKKTVATKKPAAKKPVLAPVPPVAPERKPATKPAVAKKKAVTKKTVIKKVAAKSPTPVTVDDTVITARIDIGFGNTLHVRGAGPGLSWDSGVPMNCVSDDTWSITIAGATEAISFKFLVNDLSWSAGDDFVVEPGSTVTVEPTFE